MPEQAASGSLAAGVLEALAGRKVLLVDDDIRNVFALTSALERYGMRVTHADNGRQGIDALQRMQDVEVVLMDLMMPDLDGYDTIRIVRQLDRYRTLPIIAVTAKAMVGDREKCIRAGASDYIAKPVHIETLLNMLWRCLPRK
jgi:CheY-like chemotaxis protein